MRNVGKLVFQQKSNFGERLFRHKEQDCGSSPSERFKSTFAENAHFSFWECICKCMMFPLNFRRSAPRVNSVNCFFLRRGILARYVLSELFQMSALRLNPYTCRLFTRKKNCVYAIWTSVYEERHSFWFGEPKFSAMRTELHLNWPNSSVKNTSLGMVYKNRGYLTEVGLPGPKNSIAVDLLCELKFLSVCIRKS